MSLQLRRLQLALVLLLTTAVIAQQAVRIDSIAPVHPGQEVTLTAHVPPNARCTIEVDYMSGKSRAHGLVPKTADAGGSVSWTWMVGTRTTPGRWPVKVTAEDGGHEVTATVMLEVDHR